MKAKTTLTLFISAIILCTSTLNSNPSRAPANSSLQSDHINARFEKAIGNYIEARGFPGAIIVIYKNGEPILSASYGSRCDINKVYPIASLSKLFTTAAIAKLIQENKLTADTKVVDLLDVDYQYLDERVKNITVEHLITHKGGWDRTMAADPLFNLDRAFPDIDPKTISKEDLIRQVFANVSLDHTPGTQEAYSNFGYLLLGAVIEKVTGEDYIHYINSSFAEPNGFQLHQAQTPAEYAKEIPYVNSFTMEVATPSFGLAAKIPDVAHFFSMFNRDGSPKNILNKNRLNWWKDGSLPGLTSLIRQRINDVVIVIFIPDRDENNWMKDNEALMNLIDNTANSVGL